MEQIADFRFLIAKNSDLSSLESVWLATASFSNFKDLLVAGLDSTLSKLIQKVGTVVCAAAGPVDEDGNCRPPNIEWNLTLSELENKIS